MPEPRVHVHVCCNDDNGNDTGRVSAIHLYEEDDFCEALMEMEHDYHGSEPGISQLPTLTYHGGQIVIAQKVYQLATSSRSTCVGNVFWNAYWLGESVARQLATDLMRSGEWHDTVSTEGWFWDSNTGDWKPEEGGKSC